MNSKYYQNYSLKISGNPHSCLVKIGKQKYRTLVDTGAEVSLMHRRVYDQLVPKPKLSKKICSSTIGQLYVFNGRWQHKSYFKDRWYRNVARFLCCQ